MRIPRPCALVIAACVPIGNAVAQESPAPPQEVATQPASGQPAMLIPTDAEAEAFEAFLKPWEGTLRNQPKEGAAALIMHGARLPDSLLPSAVLVEIARADAPLAPFRQFVIRGYVRQGARRVRTLELPNVPGLREAIAGLWAAPATIPSAVVDALVPTLDMLLESRTPPGRSGILTAKTEHPFPTTVDGAIETTATIVVWGNTIRLSDAGFDADGRQVWGQPAGTDIAFGHIDDAPPTVRTESGNLIIITTVAPSADSPRHTPSGELSIAFTSWTAAGVKIQSTRDPGREPIKVRVPGAPLAALDTALAGMAKGERRKVVIPPALAYGDRGRGVVPPNSTLIYDIECIDVNNTPGPPARPPAPTADPHVHPTAPVPPPPRPAPGDGPIGNPPTNPDPETPR